jgi:dihydroflavonol-4-reductase
MAQPCLVTGGSGFVASHLILQLLEGGATVHATVRSTRNKEKISALLDMQTKWPGKLKLFEADLLVPGSFDLAVQECTVVYHVASPFFMEEKIKNGQKEVVDPALKGTQNVLEAVQRSESVKTVVMTSTVGAIFGDYADVMEMENNTLSEGYFNSTSTSKHNVYHYSKTLAEKEAWRMYRLQNRWRLVTINPGLILGPSLSPKSESGSLFLLDELLRGELFFGVPRIWFTTVDVREVAYAHISAASLPEAKGRYILCGRQMSSFLEISTILRQFAGSPWWMPRHQIPNFLVRLIGPFFGLSQKWMALNLGVRFESDNRRSIEELGVTYRPLEDTLRDHYYSWKNHHDH